MPATMVLQTSAPYTNAFGGLENLGPLTYTGTAPPARQSVVLQSGNNTITVPTPASGAYIGCLITLPVVGGIVTKLKTTSGDVGINIPQSGNQPFLYLFDSTAVPTSFFLNAASLHASASQIEFF